MIKKYWINIILSAIVLSYPIGSILPFEIADSSLALYYHVSGIFIFPVLVIIVINNLFNLLPKSKILWIKISVCAIALFLTAYIFLYSISSMFGSWTSLVTFARNKKNPNSKVSEQRRDYGATGFGKGRTAQITPVLYFWNHVKEVDGSKLNPDEWDWVHEEP